MSKPRVPLELGTPLQTRVAPALEHRIERLAREGDRSVAATVRRALERGIPILEAEQEASTK